MSTNEEAKTVCVCMLSVGVSVCVYVMRCDVCLWGTKSEWVREREEKKRKRGKKARNGKHGKNIHKREKEVKVKTRQRRQTSRDRVGWDGRERKGRD